VSTGRVTVEGGRRLRATLKAAGDDLGELRAAHAAAAALVAAVATAGAPHRTGRLAGSVRGSGTKTAAIIRAGSARVPYANPIHWGWGLRHIAADPWMSRAAVGTEDRWAAGYRDEVDRILATVKGA
jgi:hypothetical protein